MNHNDADFRSEIARSTLDDLREQLIRAGMGVTLIGNSLSVRWGREQREIHAVILEVDDGTAAPVVCETPR